jgi:elongation factor Ts
MGSTPDLMFVIDTNKEAIAILEAKRLGIPVVAIIDSNCDPDKIDFPIPGNDDAARAIQLYCDLIAKAAIDGIARQQGALGVDIGALLSVEEGVVATYIHNSVADGLGKLGVLVALKSTGDKDALNAIGRQVAMHIAATNPLAIRSTEVDAAVAERERNIFIEQARESGKPEAIIEKMVDGRMRKFFEEVALLSQAFVMNPDLTVEAAVKEAEKTVGAPIEVVGMARLLLGEGVEKEETDFAAEVAAVAKG